MRLNEYIGTYQVRMRVHTGSLREVRKQAIDADNEQGRKLIFAFSSEGSYYVVKRPVEKNISLLLLAEAIRRGVELKIRVIGRLEKETLKEITDSIGRIVERDSTQRTGREMIYKSRYGHYPDEVPAKAE